MPDTAGELLAIPVQSSEINDLVQVEDRPARGGRSLRRITDHVPAHIAYLDADRCRHCPGNSGTYLRTVLHHQRTRPGYGPGSVYSLRNCETERRPCHGGQPEG
jgi:hypothetical protein